MLSPHIVTITLAGSCHFVRVFFAIQHCPPLLLFTSTQRNRACKRLECLAHLLEPHSLFSLMYSNEQMPSIRAPGSLSHESIVNIVASREIPPTVTTSNLQFLGTMTRKFPPLIGISQFPASRPRIPTPMLIRLSNLAWEVPEQSQAAATSLTSHWAKPGKSTTLPFHPALARITMTIS